MPKSRLKTVTFEASSNRLKGKALKRIGMTRTVQPLMFNMIIINQRYTL